MDDESAVPFQVGPIRDIVFVVEDTAISGSCIDELYHNYVVPTLEHMNGGMTKETPWSSVSCSNTFSLALFQSGDALPR